MSRSISRACVALAALLLSIALALGATLCLAPTAYADEATIFSQKLTKLVAGESPALTETIEAAFSDALNSAKREAFVDASVAMMVRRAAFLDGRPDWQELGLASVTADGWCSAGVKWNFETAGYDIGVIDVAGTSDALRELLDEHPEGIAAYDPNVPHAVLLTDYDEETDTFFCADPANYKAGSRIPLAESWNGVCRGSSQSRVVAGLTRAWVIQ